MRTTIAILAGFILWSGLFLGGNLLLSTVMPDRFADDGTSSDVLVLSLLLLLTAAYSVASGWCTARIAKSQRNRPALALGAVLLVVGIAVQAGYWDILPVWYHLIFLALLLPATVCGGRFGTATDA